MSEVNKWSDWIEDAIYKEHIKHYEYKYFNNIQEIGTGGFGKVYRANWNNSHRYFALKSLLNIDEVAIKELVHEVIIIMKYVIKLIDAYFWLKLFFYNLSRLDFNVKLLSIIML